MKNLLNKSKNYNDRLSNIFYNFYLYKHLKKRIHVFMKYNKNTERKLRIIIFDSL